MSAEEDLRRITDEPADNSDYTSVKLQGILTSNGGNVNLAAAQIWREKAAALAAIVDLTEGDTARKLGDMMKNAITMMKLSQDAADDGGDAGKRPTTIGRITRG